MGRPANNIDQMLARVVRDEGGCWLWTGKKVRGYGMTTVRKKHWATHRFFYTHYKGSIPDGMHIDHLCRNPSCCNPDHLEAVTCRENSLRSPFTINSINAAKVVCVHGHDLNGDNLYITPDGRRNCKTCRRAAVARSSKKAA